MKQKLKSLKFRILLPVIIITLFIVILFNSIFSHAFISMILQQEQEVNSVGFSTVSRSITPLIESSISSVRSILLDDSVASYTMLRYSSMAEQIQARSRCRDYLRGEIARHEGIYGVLFMRKDGSMFGSLPEANLFWDRPEDNPLPEDIKEQIFGASLGQTVWAGPLSGSVLCGFENSSTPKSIMIAAWKSVDVRYGECYAMMLMDENSFTDLFASIQDDKSIWHLFTEDRTEICTTGQEACPNPDQLISESNSGKIIRDENGHLVCAFSMTMDSPSWTLVREVSMENYEKVVQKVRILISVFGGLVLLASLAIYDFWLKRFMRQFYSLLKGIVRMGEGDLESTSFEPTSIEEFQKMQYEIRQTCLALGRQMETIRRMEREQMELENERKEQERIAQELLMAREIQASALPSTFPAFPDRSEFVLFASMTPAKEVGGDFYDFFLIDSDHLALVIADVSGKGIPAALFMMVSKTLIRNELLICRDPAAALTQVNLQLVEHNTSMMFVTVWVAVLEISTGKGLACNAGHENPGIRRAGGNFELLKYKHAVFIGASPKAKYENREFKLNPDDCVFVYTDGVPEASDAANGFFGDQRLIDALNKNADADPEELIHNVFDEVNQFAGDTPQFDDITMLCYKHYGSEGSSDHPHS